MAGTRQLIGMTARRSEPASVATRYLVVLAGLFFPVTWTIWYLRDERPYRRTHRHAA